jgi:hypothetical protein
MQRAEVPRPRQLTASHVFLPSRSCFCASSQNNFPYLNPRERRGLAFFGRVSCSAGGPTGGGGCVDVVEKLSPLPYASTQQRLPEIFVIASIKCRSYLRSCNCVVPVPFRIHPFGSIGWAMIRFYPILAVKLVRVGFYPFVLSVRRSNA